MDRIKTKSEINNARFKQLLPIISVGLLVLVTLIWFGAKGNEVEATPNPTSENSTAQHENSREEHVNKLTVRASVAPEKTVYLDLVEGGTVTDVHVEQGEYVKRGQLLVSLTNSSLELEVIAREAQVEEQLNNLRNTRIAMEQDALNIQREIADLEYELEALESQLRRAKTVHEQGYLSDQELDELAVERKHLKRRLAIAYERKRTNAELRDTQLAQVEQSSKNLTRNLTLARKNLDSLSVKASQSGYLSDFIVKQGEFVSRGERLGQIDDFSGIKLVAEVNEYYLGKLTVGMVAVAKVGGTERRVQLRKIYPQVENGTFTAEFALAVGPEKLRRGQTINVTVQLNDHEGLPEGDDPNHLAGR